MPEAPTPSAVRKWMRDTGRGYGAAAEHFGRNEDALREMCAPRKPKPQQAPNAGPPAPPPSSHPADLDTLDFHRMLLQKALQDIDDVPPRDRAALLNRARDERNIIDAIVKEREAAGRQRMTITQQIELMTEQYRRMPEPLLKPAFDEYVTRHRLRVLSVAVGGAAKDVD